MKEIAEDILNTKSLEHIIEAINDYALNNKYSFACWRQPDSNDVQLLIDFGHNDFSPSSPNLEQTPPGFLFAPFDTTKNHTFLHKDALITLGDSKAIESNRSTEELVEHIKNFEPKKPTEINIENEFESEFKNSFIHLVQKSIAAIKQGQFSKVVPSRQRVINLNETLQVGQVFNKLIETYPKAFVSLVYTSKSGLWVGATPELLLSTYGNTFKTVALAGTQLYDESTSLSDIAWTQKEIEEQALVSRYIINCFKKIRLREFYEHGPKTVRAGNLIHLKTEFMVDMKETNFHELGSTMLKLLHPTSAICGMPLNESLNFIHENEDYKRSFFSGYLGPVGINNQTSLYVNLRCMKIDNKQLRLYAGAGVTEDSNPLKEWEETQMKMNTLLNVIL